jgi:hypothetical protein
VLTFCLALKRSINFHAKYRPTRAPGSLIRPLYERVPFCNSFRVV